MQTLLNTLYVMAPYAYAHPENITIRVDASRDFGGYTLSIVAACDVILIRSTINSNFPKTTPA